MRFVSVKRNGIEGTRIVHGDRAKVLWANTPAYPGSLDDLVRGAMPALQAAGEQLDYEGELAVIVGKAGRHIPIESALEHVIGYSVFNDGSVAHITAQCGARAGAGRCDCVGHTGRRRHGAQAAALDEAGRCV